MKVWVEEIKVEDKLVPDLTRRGRVTLALVAALAFGVPLGIALASDGPEAPVDTSRVEVDACIADTADRPDARIAARICEEVYGR